MSVSVRRERSEGYLFSSIRYGSVGASAGTAESNASWALSLALSLEERESGNVRVEILLGSLLTFRALYFSSTSVRPEVKTAERRLLWKTLVLRRCMSVPEYCDGWVDEIEIAAMQLR
jgi:hypothetical protein